MKSTPKNIILEPFENARLDKLDVLTKLGKGEYFQNIRRPLLTEKIALCIDWLSMDKGDLDQATVKSIDSLYTEIVKIIGSHKPEPPRKSIRINGVKYKFVKRFAEMSAAWHEMVRRSDFKDYPVRMVSLCYIEDNMAYAQKGPNDIIENPTSERDKVFINDFPLGDYLNLSNFFLQKFEGYLTASNQLTETRTAEMKKATTQQNQAIKEAAKPTK
tara:strand:+ start:2454 stop:3101 length:648 start_codon:yes stop_codon:yes gene_type:complete